MVILLLFVSFVLFVLGDIAVRELTRRVQDKARREERRQALEQSVSLDFTREAKSLKRVEVKDPSARILCVDDEEVILSAFRKILVLEGCSVDTVESGREALGLVQTHHYDFVFTDLRMPAMDGVEVVKSVKHMRPDIDVIVVTGYASVETAVECMKHGAMDYIQKPFTEAELLAMLKKSLIKRRDRIERQLRPAVRVTHAAEAEGRPAGELSIPGGVLVSAGHSWAALAPDGTVKVGLDDFAKKLIGEVEALELPNPGMTVKAGQPLFAARGAGRTLRFPAPVSGRVTRVNQALAGDPEALDLTPYHKNWVCVIEADALDADLKELRIGRAAVALFEEDLERLRKAIGNGDGPAELSVGELARLDDARWSRVEKTLFSR